MYAHFHQKPLKRVLLEAFWRYKWLTLCFAVSLYFFAASGYIHAKAELAQYLIKDAWTDSLSTGKNVPPWSWADTYPVAKMTVAGQSLYILAGASGRVLAFGPGHISATVLPGETGNAVITGHRDTHFAVLEQVNIGDMIETQTGRQKNRFRITEIRIAHESQVQVTADSENKILTLITCYPFNGVDPNPEMRYIVRAQWQGETS